MKKNLILIIFIIIILLFLSVETGLSHNNGAVEKTDWWTMHLHDARNSGFSRSKAPDTNNTLWISSTNDRIISSPAIADNRVYIGSGDQNVYCYNATNGEEIWNYATGWMVTSSPAVWDDYVYIASDDSYLYCLNKTDGSHVWSFQTNSWFWIYSSPTIANGRVYIGGGDDGRVYCLDANPLDDDIDEGIPDGNEGYDLIWTYQTGYWTDSTPSIIQNKVFIGSYDGFLYCLDAEDGHLIWRFDTSEYDYNSVSFEPQDPTHVIRYITSSPSIHRDKVIFSTTDGTIFCLAISDGEEVWRTKAGLGGERTSPIVAYGKVYYGSSFIDMEHPYDHMGKLYCLDAYTGRLLWEYTVTGEDFNSVGAHYCSVADNKVYFGISSFYTDPDYIFCIDAHNGRFIWNYEVGHYAIGAPAIANNKLYATSYDGNIYCFEDI